MHVHRCILSKWHDPIRTASSVLLLFLTFRPPNIHVGGLIFYQGFFLSLFIFVSYPPSSLNGTHLYLATWSEVSVIWKCMSEIWSVPFPYNRGPKTTFSRRLCILTATLTAYVFGVKHGKCVANYEGRPKSSQNDMNFGPQTASNWRWVLPTLRKFCILSHCQVSQTEISKRNSTKLCQTLEVGRANNLS